jgi:hypothetical protein
MSLTTPVEILASKVLSETSKKSVGRPRGSISKKTKIAIKLREQLAQAFYERFDPIIQAQLDVAQGIKLEVQSKDGEIYYKDPGPNTFAFKTILEQIIGRPLESIKLSDNDEKPLALGVVFNLAIKKIYGDNTSTRGGREIGTNSV